MTDQAPCKRCGGTGKEHPHRNRKLDWQEVLDLAEIGWTTRDIALRMKCTENAVRNVLKKSEAQK